MIKPKNELQLFNRHIPMVSLPFAVRKYYSNIIIKSKVITTTMNKIWCIQKAFKFRSASLTISHYIHIFFSKWISCSENVYTLLLLLFKYQDIHICILCPCLTNAFYYFLNLYSFEWVFACLSLGNDKII